MGLRLIVIVECVIERAEVFLFNISIMLDFAGRPKGRFIMRGVVGIFILEMALINIQGGNAAGMVSGGGIDSTRRD